MREEKKFHLSYQAVLLILMLGLCLILSLLSPHFLTAANIRNLFNQSAVMLLLAVGMTFVIASGSIDLSVGSIIGFSGMIMAVLSSSGRPAWECIAWGLAASAGVGLVNGAFAAYLRINSFIVTLCTMTILRGVVLLVLKSDTLFGFGPVFAFFGGGDIGPLKVPILLSVGAFLIGWLVLRTTRYGSRCLFLGSNRSALTRCGVSAEKYTILVFVFSGLLAGIAGLVVLGRLDAAQPLAGSGYEMDAIAAVILGGTVLEGGRGSMVGTFLGCLTLNILSNCLVLLSVSTHYQEILTGSILLFAVVLSERSRSHDSV
jgi:ribose transport system permease protein